MTSVDTRYEHLDAIFGGVTKSTRCAAKYRRALEDVLQLAVELAREGREGRKIGTLFVVGDVEQTLTRSRSLLLDPLYGHAPDLLQAARPEFRETVKELAQLDGAFLVDWDGTFAAACRFIEVDLASPGNFMAGLGTRHAAAASISASTGAIAIVVSQSSIVRVFARGEVRAEIIPELFLMSGQQLFTQDAEVRQLPDVGITLAVADGNHDSDA